MTTAGAPHRRRLAWPAVGLLLLVLTGLAATLPGTGDMGIWERWIGNARRLGVVAAFGENAADYPPLAHALLAVTGMVGPAMAAGDALAIKLSLAIALGLSVAVFFAWTRRAGLALGLWAALLLNSVALGYLDIYTAPCLLLSLWALDRGRLTAALTWFAAACLVKWQPAVAAPFLFAHALNASGGLTRDGVKKTAVLMAPAVALVVALGIAFGIVPFAWAFAKSLGHRSLSAEALNLGWIITWIMQGVSRGAEGLLDRVVYVASAPLGVRLLLKALFAGQFLWLLVRYARGPAGPERTTAYAMVGFLAYVMFNSGVHENHWFVPSLLAMVLAYWHPVWRAPALAVALAANVNLLLFYGIGGQGPGAARVVGMDPTVPLAALAIGGYVWIWRILAAQEPRYSSIRQ